MKLKLTIILSLLTSICLTSYGQILKPVKWSYASKKSSASEAIIYLKADIQDGWHLYSQYIKEGGPIKTTFKFKPSKMISFIGNTSEPKPLTSYEKVFNMNVSYFAKQVVFQQKIKVKPGAKNITGTVEFMVCDDKQCLPPEEISFTIPIK